MRLLSIREFLWVTFQNYSYQIYKVFCSWTLNHRVWSGLGPNISGSGYGSNIRVRSRVKTTRQIFKVSCY